MRLNQSFRFFRMKGLLISCLFMIGGIHAKSIESDQVDSMNELIDNYYIKGSLSIAEQSKFVKNFKAFEAEIEAMQDDWGTEELKRAFLDPYREWASVMITQTSMVQLLQENTPESSSDRSSEDVSALESDESFDQLHFKTIKDLYTALETQLLGFQNSFCQSVSASVKSVQSYQDFIKMLKKQQEGYVKSVGGIKKSIYRDYSDFLEDNKRSSDYRDMDPVERDFLDNVTSIADQSVQFVQSFVLDITSQASKADLETRLSEALEQERARSLDEYEKQLEANKAKPSTWWEEVKASGKDLFVNEFSTQLKQELNKQINEAIEKEGAKLASDLGGQVAKKIKQLSPALAQKIESLKGALKLESVSDLINGTSSASLKVLRTLNPVVPPASPVSVATDIGLCPQEKTFIKNRLPKVQKVLKDTFEIDQPLRVAFCCSGGGNRAMIGTLGLLTGAAKTKVLNASMYIVGLSGSTWTIAPWSYLYLQGKIKAAGQNQDFVPSFNQMRKNWQTALDNPKMVQTLPGCYTPAPISGANSQDFLRQIAFRAAYGAPMSLIDLYAGMIGNMALELAAPHSLEAKWSSIAGKAQHGLIPLPLCSNVFDPGTASVKKSGQHSQYEWFESGPFQAGSTVLGYIPVQYFGSSFVNGSLQYDKDKPLDGELRPEYPLSFYMGLYGSAFSLSLNDIVDKGVPVPAFSVYGVDIKVPVDEWVRGIVDEQTGGKTRSIRPEQVNAHFANFSKGLSSSKMQKQDQIALFDGGINFNFPLPLLLDRPERGIDLVIIYDSNDGDEPTFKDAADYFKRKGIAVPDLSKITHKQLMSAPMTVFNDPKMPNYDSSKPTFIYFPTLKFMTQSLETALQNAEGKALPSSDFKTIDIGVAPYVTTNFRYNAEQMNALADSMEYAFTSNIESITAIMQKVAVARYPNVIVSKSTTGKASQKTIVTDKGGRKKAAGVQIKN